MQSNRKIIENQSGSVSQSSATGPDVKTNVDAILIFTVNSIDIYN